MGKTHKKILPKSKRWDDVSKITKDELISIESRYSKKIRQHENPIKLEKSKNRQKEVLYRIREINSLLKLPGDYPGSEDSPEEGHGAGAGAARTSPN